MKISHIAATIAFVAATGLGVAAQAQTWDQAHPRRAEVNGRLANQNARVDQGLKQGELSRSQAHALHAQDHAIRAEERADAAVNGGHITRSEQRTINRQENAVSREIHRGRSL